MYALVALLKLDRYCSNTTEMLAVFFLLH